MCTGLPSILQSYFVRKPVGRQGPVVLIKLNGQILNTCSAHSYLNSTECSEEDSQEIWSGRRPHPQISTMQRVLSTSCCSITDGEVGPELGHSEHRVFVQTSTEVLSLQRKPKYWIGKKCCESIVLVFAYGKGVILTCHGEVTT